MSETTATTTVTSSAVTTGQAWRAITAVLTGAILPGLGYDPAPLGPAQVADLVLHQVAGGAR